MLAVIAVALIGTTDQSEAPAAANPGPAEHRSSIAGHEHDSSGEAVADGQRVRVLHEAEADFTAEAWRAIGAMQAKDARVTLGLFEIVSKRSYAWKDDESLGLRCLESVPLWRRHLLLAGRAR